MDNYIVAHIPASKKAQRPGIPMVPRYITIHSNGNANSTAKNERDNLARENNNDQVSFHIAVDDVSAYEAIPPTEVTWNAGDGRGPGNMQSISIELCERGDREATLRNGALIAAELLIRFGLDITAIRQHYDWSKKNCPKILRETGRWDEFLFMISKNLVELQPEPVPPVEVHWAEKYLQELVNLGIVETPENWEDFDAPASKGELLALVLKAFNKR